jgi:DNA-damage-inducible protein J
MTVQNDVRVTIRVDRDLKEHAEVLFERMGMNMSTALNIFLRKAVDESAIPFPISTKNTSLGYGLSPSDVSDAFTAAVQEAVSEKKQNGFPVALYDADKKQAYLEFADGTREYVNG